MMTMRTKMLLMMTLMMIMMMMLMMTIMMAMTSLNNDDSYTDSQQYHCGPMCTARMVWPLPPSWKIEWRGRGFVFSWTYRGLQMCSNYSQLGVLYILLQNYSKATGLLHPTDNCVIYFVLMSGCSCVCMSRSVNPPPPLVSGAVGNRHVWSGS